MLAPVLKWLERLVFRHIFFISPTFATNQFVNRTNRSTEDDIAVAQHAAMSSNTGDKHVFSSMNLAFYLTQSTLKYLCVSCQLGYEHSRASDEGPAETLFPESQKKTFLKTAGVFLHITALYLVLWFSSCIAAQMKILQGIIKPVQKITGYSLTSLEKLCSFHYFRKVMNIL